MSIKGQLGIAIERRWRKEVVNVMRNAWKIENFRYSEELSGMAGK